MRVALLLALAASPPLTITIGEIPLEPGTWWEFRESYTEHLGGLDSISDDTTRFEVRGTPERPFLKQEGGADPSSAPIEVGDGWIRLGAWTGEEPLPLPLEPGRTGPPSEGGPGWSVEAEEEVGVPAGTFRTLRCALRTRETESVLWIALGVGIVRETQGARRKRPDIERVLTKWGGPKGPSGGPRDAPPPAR
jgi:hypothetical protein